MKLKALDKTELNDLKFINYYFFIYLFFYLNKKIECHLENSVSLSPTSRFLSRSVVSK